MEHEWEPRKDATRSRVARFDGPVAEMRPSRVLAPTGRLYVWHRPITNPAFSRLGDHTWVTSHPKGLSSPPLRDYWYCTGDATTIGALLGSQDADISLAVCLDTPNVHRRCYAGQPCADAGYMRDGVCHQMTNRILAATATGRTPLTLDKYITRVNGYRTSRRFYGVYGKHVDDWLRIVRERCGVDLRLAGAHTMNHLDDVREQVTTALGNNVPETLITAVYDLEERLKAEDDATCREHDAGNITTREYIARVNATNGRYQEGLARILTRDQYRAFMGVYPEERIDLLDPSVLDGQTR